MGLMHDGIIQSQTIINNVQSNKIVNNQRIWNKSKDKTVLDDLLLWCSGTKSAKTATQWSDLSGNNNHITLSNASIVNDCFFFNGVDTLATLPLTHKIWETGATCIILPQYLSAVNTKGIIGDAGPSSGAGFFLGQYENSQMHNGFYPNSPDGRIIVSWNNTYLTNGVNAFNEIAFTYDKNIESFYINGVLMGSKDIGQATLSSENMVLGRSMNQSTRYFNGYLADIKFYSKALSAQEVLQNYAQNQSEEIVD